LQGSLAFRAPRRFHQIPLKSGAPVKVCLARPQVAWL
jgi:hypothetical protein